MSKPRILVVEDEADIRHFIRLALEKENIAGFEAANAAEARVEAASRRPDLLIVDLGLPDDDGKALIKDLRAWCAVPIIVLSAREQESEKVAALDAGADDYLTKPFGVPELLARVRAQLRRKNLAVTPDSSTFGFGDVVIDLATHEVRRAGELVHLTPIEFRLLRALMQGHGRVLTHRQLLTEVWGGGHADRQHYLRIYMANLRQKLEQDPTRPQHLITELAVGYRLSGLTSLAPQDEPPG